MFRSQVDFWKAVAIWIQTVKRYSGATESFDAVENEMIPNCSTTEDDSPSPEGEKPVNNSERGLRAGVRILRSGFDCPGLLVQPRLQLRHAVVYGERAVESEVAFARALTDFSRLQGRSRF